MRITPRIDLAGGESLHALNDPASPDRPLEDPVDITHCMERNGAIALQVVDVDRATGVGNNDEELVRILDAARVPVEAGGGVGSMRRIQELLDSGVARVLVGTMGIQHPAWLAEVGTCFSDRVVHVIEVREGIITIKGRTQDSPHRLEVLANAADACGFARVQFNACDARPDAQLRELLSGFAASFSTPVGLGAANFTEESLSTWRQAGVQVAVAGPELYSGALALSAIRPPQNAVVPNIRN